MSTILETLKKLEEDKKLLDRELALKELVLSEDKRSQVTLKISRKSFLIAGLVFLAIILTGLIFFKRTPNETHLTYLPPVELQQKLEPVESKVSDSTVGIPLSNIPERRQPNREKAGENSLQDKKAPARNLLQSVVEHELPKIETIRDVIQNTKTETEPSQLKPYPEELVSRGVSIPNLKVKGIIFFSSGSPSNHIFVSTLESKNRKARVGDTIQSATLTHIQSNRVIFSYQGETVQLRIGE